MMPTKSQYTLDNVKLVIENLRFAGYQKEVPRSVLIHEIQTVTGLIHPLATTQFMKGLAASWLAKPLGAGAVWELADENEE